MAAHGKVEEFFDALGGKIAKRRGELSGVSATLQFRVGEHRRWLRLEDGEGEVGEGDARAPDCVVTVSEEDFLDLVEGKTSPQAAFLTGRIKVAGNFAVALHLGSLVRS